MTQLAAQPDQHFEGKLAGKRMVRRQVGDAVPVRKTMRRHRLFLPFPPAAVLAALLLAVFRVARITHLRRAVVLPRNFLLDLFLPCSHATPKNIGDVHRKTVPLFEHVDTDQVLFAVGRRPNTRGLGLERAGVQLDQSGAVVVDEYSRSSVGSVFAIGDVTNRVNLTPVAIRDGHAFADSIYNQRSTPVDHRSVPSAVFGRPPIGTVGLGEGDARHSHGEVDIYRTNFRPMRNMLSGNQERTLMKLVVDRKTGRLLGVHMAGEDAPEIIQLAAVAVKAGLTKEQWDSTVALHPTAAEELVLLREPVRVPG